MNSPRGSSQASLLCPTKRRRRRSYATLVVVSIVLGLASRRFGNLLPTFVAEFAGDTLWASMAYFGISFLIPKIPIDRRALLAMIFATAIELSQLYKPSWLEAIRKTTLGGLVLGFEFLWTDLACYAVGVALAALVDFMINVQPRTQRNSRQ